MGEGGADGCGVGGGGWVCCGGHCCGGSGESGEDECSAAGAGVDVCLAGLAGVGLGVLFVSDPFGGAWWWCWELVEEVGLFFGGFSGHVGLSGRAEKLCHRVFGLVGGFSVTQVTQGSICMVVTGVCARVCVCHLLVKVVSLVSPISTLTRENPGDTRVKSCVTLCHLVSPKCLPDVGIFELQTAEHAPAAVCRAEKLCHRVFGLVGGFSVTQVTQGSICMVVTGVCARVCVCHLLVKVVSLVSPISTLTRENPGDTRVKSCVTLCHLVSPKCLPDVGIFELQTAEHAPAAVCRARCVSTDQHPVHLQLGGERPALDRLQPFLGTPDVVCLA